MLDNGLQIQKEDMSRITLALNHTLKKVQVKLDKVSSVLLSIKVEEEFIVLSLSSISTLELIKKKDKQQSDLC